MTYLLFTILTTDHNYSHYLNLPYIAHIKYPFSKLYLYQSHSASMQSLPDRFYLFVYPHYSATSMTVAGSYASLPSLLPRWLLTTRTPFLTKSQHQCVCPCAHNTTFSAIQHTSPVNSLANADFVGRSCPANFESLVPSTVGA